MLLFPRVSFAVSSRTNASAQRLGCRAAGSECKPHSAELGTSILIKYRQATMSALRTRCTTSAAIWQHMGQFNLEILRKLMPSLAYHPAIWFVFDDSRRSSFTGVKRHVPAEVRRCCMYLQLSWLEPNSPLIASKILLISSKTPLTESASAVGSAACGGCTCVSSNHFTRQTETANRWMRQMLMPVDTKYHAGPRTSGRYGHLGLPVAIDILPN